MIRGKVNDEVTDEINFRFSELFFQQASKNLETHRFKDPDFGAKMEVLNTYVGYTFYPNNYVLSYGLNDWASAKSVKVSQK